MKSIKKRIPILLSLLLLLSACGEPQEPAWTLADTYETVVSDVYDLKLDDDIEAIRQENGIETLYPIGAAINGDNLLVTLAAEKYASIPDYLLLASIREGTAYELRFCVCGYDVFLADDGDVVGLFANDAICVMHPDGTDHFTMSLDGMIIGTDHNDAVWQRGEAELIRTDFDDGSQIRYAVPEGYTPFEFVFSDDSADYFIVNDAEYNYFVMYTDRENLTLEKVPDAGCFQSWYDGRLTYNTNDCFYFTESGSCTAAVAVNKERTEEFIWQIAEKNLISGYTEKQDNDDGTVTDRMYLTSYDLSGSVLDKLDENMITGGESLVGLDCDNDGRAVISVFIDGKPHILLWDTASKRKNDTEYETLNLADMSDSVAASVAELEERHGVEVIYEKEGVEEYGNSYTLIPADMGIELYGAIRTLDRSLDGYPRAMLSKIESYEGNPLRIYLGSDFVRINEYSIGSAAAVADSTWDYLTIAFAISYTDSLEQNLSHELTHILDGFVEDYMHKSNLDLMNYWTYGLNSEEYPYYYTYVDQYGIDVNVSSDLALRGDACKWFIDTYSRSFPTEDRARIFEHLYMGYDSFFESEELIKKARFLTAVLRAVFPDMAEEGEVLRWEKTCGVSDISEFIPEIDKFYE